LLRSENRSLISFATRRYLTWPGTVCLQRYMFAITYRSSSCIVFLYFKKNALERNLVCNSRLASPWDSPKAQRKPAFPERLQTLFFGEIEGNNSLPFCSFSRKTEKYSALHIRGMEQDVVWGWRTEYLRLRFSIDDSSNVQPRCFLAVYRNLFAIPPVSAVV
jgi:hypothetical protein